MILSRDLQSTLFNKKPLSKKLKSLKLNYKNLRNNYMLKEYIDPIVGYKDCIDWKFLIYNIPAGE